MSFPNWLRSPKIISSESRFMHGLCWCNSERLLPPAPEGKDDRNSKNTASYTYAHDAYRRVRDQPNYVTDRNVGGCAEGPCGPRIFAGTNRDSRSHQVLRGLCNVPYRIICNIPRFDGNSVRVH